MTSLKGIQVSSNTEGNKMTNETEFRVGDRVSLFGREGIVSSLNLADPYFPLTVTLDGKGECVALTVDGKIFSWANESVLKLISRPTKRKGEKMTRSIKALTGFALVLIFLILIAPIMGVFMAYDCWTQNKWLSEVIKT
jgi:hypothetical protein